MDEDEKNDDILNLICTVQKQHKSLVISIPKLIVNHMDLEAGDYVCFAMIPGESYVELSLKQKKRHMKNERKRNTFRQYSDRD